MLFKMHVSNCNLDKANVKVRLSGLKRFDQRVIGLQFMV